MDLRFEPAQPEAPSDICILPQPWSPRREESSLYLVSDLFPGLSCSTVEIFLSLLDVLLTWPWKLFPLPWLVSVLTTFMVNCSLVQPFQKVHLFLTLHWHLSPKWPWNTKDQYLAIIQLLPTAPSRHLPLPFSKHSLPWSFPEFLFPVWSGTVSSSSAGQSPLMHGELICGVKAFTLPALVALSACFPSTSLMSYSGVLQGEISWNQLLPFS